MTNFNYVMPKGFLARKNAMLVFHALTSKDTFLLEKLILHDLVSCGMMLRVIDSGYLSREFISRCINKDIPNAVYYLYGKKTKRGKRKSVSAFKYAAAKAKNVDESILYKLCRNPDSSIRNAVASNRFGLSDRIVSKLLSYNDFAILHSLVGNDALTEKQFRKVFSVVETVVGSRLEMFISLLFSNKNCPSCIIDEIINNKEYSKYIDCFYSDSNITSEQISRIYNLYKLGVIKGSAIIDYIVSNRNTSISVLREVVGTESGFIKRNASGKIKKAESSINA